MMMVKSQSDGPYMAAAIDEAALRRRVWFKHFSTPWILGPFLLSVTALAVLWTFSIQSGVALFAGLCGVLLSLGGLVTRLLTGSEAITKQAAAELSQEAQAAKDRALDDLDKRLQGDGDKRTETCLRDLRAFARVFRDETVWTQGLDESSIYGIVSGVEQLFNQSVQALEHSLELFQAAQTVSSPEARQPILAQREKLIQDVTKSIQQLGRILAEMQGMGQGPGEDGSKLASIRQELDQSLEVARRVDARMNQLSRDLDTER
jgi:hypothetical protein